jgi:hypothetical protein
MVMSVSACIAFAVYYQMIGQTYLEYVSPDTINVSFFLLGLGVYCLRSSRFDSILIDPVFIELRSQYHGNFKKAVIRTGCG